MVDTMSSDASMVPAGDATSGSAARVAARAHLVRTLEQMRTIDDRRAFDAVALLVDMLVSQSATPEATVIEVKGAIEESACLTRFERSLRERVRVALVACCINRYFEARESFGFQTPTSPPRVIPAPGPSGIDASL
jgi:hypothetical protein